MKKFLVLLVAGIFVFGCAPAKKGTCPHGGKGVEEAGSPPPPATRSVTVDSAEDAPEPAATGYGDDPGEETQE
jgi:hypothetical protein